VEIGAENNAEMKKMAPLPGQLQKNAIMVLLRKIAENSDMMAEGILGT
jgi:hypothetical protein